MALSRIANTSDLLTNLSRVTHSVNASVSEMQCTRYAAVHQSRIKGLHVTSIRRYPDAPALPLPSNVSQIFANETGRFTPERARDIAAPVLLYGKSGVSSFTAGQTKQSFERSNIPPIREDTHVDSYDCFGAVSLNGTMQSNVPKPFSSRGKSTHLNMPGGQWARDGKYIAEDMQKSHYRSNRLPQFKVNKNGFARHAIITSSFSQTTYHPRYICNMGYSTNVPKQPSNTGSQSSDVSTQRVVHMSKKDRFKQVIKDYGYTVIVFHVGISLISLGGCYMAVVSGIDARQFIQLITGADNEQLNTILGTSTTFVLAYTVHKVLAPLRLGITLAVVPLLVRYLRRVGILKHPKL